MTNALNANPPAPNPQPQDGLNQSNALGGVPAQNAQIPAPNHEQTVAALRHFQMIGKELQGLLINPDIGKSDMRSSIIDAVTRLVAARIIAPGQAVLELGKVPDRPFDQKQAIEKMFQQNMQAEMAVLEHHGATNAAQSDDFATENARFQGNPDNHMDTMNSMMGAHYNG